MTTDEVRGSGEDAVMKAKMMKLPPCVWGYLGIMAMVGVACFSIAESVRRSQKHQEKVQKDQKTDMTLIDMKGNVTDRGYAGIMFFSGSAQTNRADAVMHYTVIKPETLDKIRHLKLGQKRKVSEWKGLFDEDQYVKRYSWYELKR